MDEVSVAGGALRPPSPAAAQPSGRMTARTQPGVADDLAADVPLRHRQPPGRALVRADARRVPAPRPPIADMGHVCSGNGCGCERGNTSGAPGPGGTGAHPLCENRTE
ncbi:hypothetical protein GCM10018785_23440 [Streptomyces longispororuber]|uniref:Uncharacterized protein n=1 Tax=Streptomyces longispororuber TaxID=68230 RepID=A0A918ZIH6_9ACTN|nr:hypothetical protein GCM10018785_23440 [Streptomyces longispororuber]